MNRDQVNGAWRNYFVDVARKNVMDVAEVRNVHADQPTARGALQASLLMELVLWIAKRRGEYIQVLSN